MTNQEIYELMHRFEHSSIQTMKLSTAECTLELSKQQNAAPASAAPVAAIQETHHAANRTAGKGMVIAAPLAGVFYAASAPGEKPYVAVGDRVKKGDTVCLMEAMKMISEIPAPCDCIITEIFKKNSELAAFDEPLIGYQPC